MISGTQAITVLVAGHAAPRQQALRSAPTTDVVLQRHPSGVLSRHDHVSRGRNRLAVAKPTSCQTTTTATTITKGSNDHWVR